MSLTSIICQDKAIAEIQTSMAADRLAHAYIFAGPEGVGKFTTAKEWAKTLLCLSPLQQDDFIDSCGTCESCRLCDEGNHPDRIMIYKELIKFTKDGKNKTTPLDMPKDVIDEFMIETANKTPQLSQRKIYIVSEAEKVNASSQNAMLKLLEEPPSHCIIILICCREEQLLPTTKSRCRTVRFGPLTEKAVVEQLTGIGIQKIQARFWARFCEGSLGDAMEWSQLNEKISCFQIKQDLIHKLTLFDYSQALTLAEWLSKSAKTIAESLSKKHPDISKKDMTRRAQKTMIRILISAMNDAIKLNTVSEPILIHEDQSADIKKIAARFNVETAAEKIVKAYENIRWIDASVNEKLIFEELLLNLGN